MSKNILIIDDDFSLRKVIEKALKNSKTNIKSVSTISEAWVDIEKNEFDLIICDVVLPDGDGLELVKKVKLKKNSQSFIIISAKNNLLTAIKANQLDVVDYLPKPFEPKELVLRIDNILAKTKKDDLKRVIEFGSIKIDLNKLFIYRESESLKINNTEKIILEKMINSPGKIFKREEIGNFIDLDKERSIDVIITRLRKKIEENPKSPKYLQTIRGEGYVLWIE